MPHVVHVLPLFDWVVPRNVPDRHVNQLLTLVFTYLLDPPL